jgi:hypothetical protein
MVQDDSTGQGSQAEWAEVMAQIEAEAQAEIGGQAEALEGVRRLLADPHPKFRPLRLSPPSTRAISWESSAGSTSSFAAVSRDRRRRVMSDSTDMNIGAHLRRALRNQALDREAVS